METTDNTRATEGITDDDRERIQAYLSMPAYRRTPHMLCPSEE
ncbi:hypothetical protein [Halogranum amylolyticum]|nr:hypothetical protein [Halogranum amylolyticum]